MVTDQATLQASAIAAAVSAALGSAEIKYRLTVLEDRMAKIESSLLRTETQLEKIEVAANRWRGGLIVIVALGSIISWVVSLWVGWTRGIR